MKRAILTQIILMLVFLGTVVSAQKVALPTIHADDQQLAEDLWIAKGNVELAWEDYRIYADYMELNQKTRVVMARGRVTMVSKETVISGEKLEFNLKEKTGVLYDTFGQMAPSIRYKSKKLTQVDNETLTFKKIDFTSCAQCLPRWRITCSKGKIKKERYIEMKNAVLKVKKIPIFYIPYMRYPLDSDGRATGFLFPGIGSSSHRGFFMLNSFFWNISKNVDNTFGFDYYGKAGIGLSDELRYLTRSMEGKVKFYWFKYKADVVLPQGETPPDDTFWSTNTSDYILKMTHRQSIDFLKTKIIIDIDKQSDANFQRLFSNDFDSVLQRISKSSISISSSISNLNFGVSGSQRDTYYTFNNSSRTMRYLPKIFVNLNQQKIWKIPGYLSFNAQYTGVTSIGKRFDDEGTELVTDISTQRLNINPSYSLNLLKAPWAFAKLTILSKHSFYPKSRDPKTKKILDEGLHLSYNTAQMDFKGPTVTKIFEFSKTRIKHIIIPGITMRYVTKVDDEDRARLIPVDNFDFPSYSYIGFSLTNRLLVKPRYAQSAKELLSLIVSQDYYFDPSLASRGRSINGLIPKFSELKTTLRIRPLPSFLFDAQVAYNHFVDAETFLDNITRLRIALSYNDRKSPVVGSFNYSRYINPYVASSYIFNRDTVGGSLNVNFPRFPLKFDGRVNYDITDKEFRHASFKLSYDYQCIKFLTELKLFKYGGRTESQFNVGITFGNMGAVKDFLGVDD